MNWNETLKRYKVGQIVTANIEKIDHAGIHCKIDGGVQGYARRAEAALTRRVVNLHQLFQPNQLIQARITGFNQKYNTIDLSIRQAAKQPWDDFVGKVKVGDFIEGQVVLLTESKALVEIKPGVTGLLPRQEMWMHAETVDQILMVDDRVRLQIVKIDESQKMLHLSARGLFADEKDVQQRNATFKIEEKLNKALEIYRWEQTKQIRRKYALSKKFRSLVKKIYLVVGEPTIAEPLLHFLKSFGIAVERINSDSLQRVTAENERAMFILGCRSGGDFSKTLEQLVAAAEKMPVLVIGTAEVLAEHQTVLKKNRLGNVQLKAPHSAEALIAALNNIAEENDLPEPEAIDDLPLPPDFTGNSEHQDATILLSEMKCLTRATEVVIFQLNMNSMETEVYASTIDNFTLSEFDRGHLQFSPISDVIVDGDFVFEKGGGFNFKYMKPLGFFESLVGIRINVTDEFGYGLFFIGKRPAQFTNLDKSIFNFCELAARGQIEHQKLLERTINEQKFLLTGKMTANFMHEIKNQIQAMEYWLEVMRTDSILLNSGKLKGTNKEFLARFEQSVNGAQEAEKRTRDIEELFLKMLRPNDKKEIVLEKFMTIFVQTVQPVAARSGIRIKVSSEKKIRAVVNLSQLNQILINLFMNSLEFIPLVRKSTGEILINIYHCKDDDLPLKLEFSDNGPGVNERNREKIFALLYTTKKGGSGLGLAISRRLAEEMGGRLVVKETRRLSGVTFLLELPQH